MDMSTLMNSDQVWLAAAIGLGLLAGLERERHGVSTGAPLAAGVRTHILVNMCGFGCAWLFRRQATLMLPAGLLAVATWARWPTCVKRARAMSAGPAKWQPSLP